MKAALATLACTLLALSISAHASEDAYIAKLRKLLASRSPPEQSQAFAAGA